MERVLARAAARSPVTPPGMAAGRLDTETVHGDWPAVGKIAPAMKPSDSAARARIVRIRPSLNVNRGGAVEGLSDWVGRPGWGLDAVALRGNPDVSGWIRS